MLMAMGYIRLVLLFLSICLAIVEFFVFLRVQSQLDNAQGNGPEGCFKTSLISTLQPGATKTIFPNNLLSAFRIISFPGTFVLFFNFLRELKVLSFSLGCLSLNSLYAFSSRRDF